VDEVLARMPGVEAGMVLVDVADGVVKLTGRLYFRSAADQAVRATARIPGVVDVVNELGYDVDDRLGVASEIGAPFGVA